MLETINLIKDEAVKQFTIDSLNNAPFYFWVAKASSSGKYHPQCTNKEGGLLIHVKRTAFMANRLCSGFQIEGIDRDKILSAAILHDIAKVPGTKVCKEYGMDCTSEDFENHPINASKYLVHSEHTAEIVEMIRHHMGPWTPESIKKPLGKYTKGQLIVYLADYMATTKEIDTSVDGYGTQ